MTSGALCLAECTGTNQRFPFKSITRFGTMLCRMVMVPDIRFTSRRTDIRISLFGLKVLTESGSASSQQFSRSLIGIVRRPWSNQTVQRIGASRFTHRQIERQRRLAPIADLCVGRGLFKIMKPATSRALIAAGVVALTIGALSIPNILQGFITAVSSFFLLVLVLFISMWLFGVAGWAPRKQRIFTWLIAVCVGASALSLSYFLLGLCFCCDERAQQRSLDRTRAGRVSFQFGRHRPPASVSSSVKRPSII